MDEKKTSLESPASEEVKDVEKKSSNKDKNEKNVSFFGKVKNYLLELRTEFAKIIWITREELVKKTFTVVVVSLMVGVIIFVMDSVFNFGYSALFGLIKK